MHPAHTQELHALDQVAATSEDLISTCDAHGRLLAVNRGMAEWLACSREELIGRSFLELVAEPDRGRALSVIERARVSGMAIDALRLLTMDGRAIPVCVCAMFDADDHVYEMIFRDISERLRTEEEAMRRAEMLEEQNSKVLSAIEQRDRFCRAVSHELRTPLTSIIGFTEMLIENEDEPLTPNQRRYVSRVAENAQRLLNMVNGLLDLSKLDTCKVRLELTRIRLGPLLQRVAADLEPLARDKRLDLAVEVPRDLPEITTDQEKLVRIVTNLLSNAIKFTEQGSVSVSASQGHDAIHIAVTDTGVGIPAHDVPHIFEEFHRASGPGRRQPGTGLGLSIAQGLAKLLGGEISVRSEEHVGSTFTLHIPINPDPTLEQFLRQESGAV